MTTDTAPTHHFDLNTPAGVQSYLTSDGSFLTPRTSITSVSRVSGGLANHTYRVVLKYGDADDEENKSLILKYSPPTIANNPNFPLTAKRGFFEFSALEHIPRFQNSTHVVVEAATPVHYDAEAHVLAVADAGGSSKNLKQHLIEGGDDLDIGAIGTALGEWLAELHIWGQTDAAGPIRTILSQNKEMADVGLQYTFAGLTPDDDPIFKEVRKYVSDIQKSDPNTSNYVVHGDFWTGNIIVSGHQNTENIRLTVIDWEASNCRPLPWNDIGQMCAEMYEPSFFELAGNKGTELVSAFIKAYRSKHKLTREDVRMAVVRFGTHLFVWPGLSGWGDEESVSRCTGFGRTAIERGWTYDWEWVQNSVLRDLISEDLA